jgi:hypothetical protein
LARPDPDLKLKRRVVQIRRKVLRGADGDGPGAGNRCLLARAVHGCDARRRQDPQAVTANWRPRGGDPLTHGEIGNDAVEDLALALAHVLPVPARSFPPKPPLWVRPGAPRCFMTPQVCRGRYRGRQLVRGSQLPLSRGSSVALGADLGGPAAVCAAHSSLSLIMTTSRSSSRCIRRRTSGSASRSGPRGRICIWSSRWLCSPRGSTRPLNTELTVFDPPARSHKRGRSKRTHSLMAAGACVNSTRKRAPHRPGRRSASGCASAGCSTPARWPGRWRSRRPPRQAAGCPPRPRPPRLRRGARGSTAVWCG